MESIVSKEEYLNNPCGLLSIPYWKAKIVFVPDSIEILHHKKFKNQKKEFQRYFRLIHHLDKIGPIPKQVQFLEITEDLVSLINICFKAEHIIVSLEDLYDMQKHSTYRKDLWIGIEVDDRLIGCAIAAYDLECREGSIEWICVLPEYQRKGYGSKLVYGLLYQLKELGADFVTVSGRLDNISHPEKLYRSCAFTGSDVWYICKKEE